MGAWVTFGTLCAAFEADANASETLGFEFTGGVGPVGSAVFGVTAFGWLGASTGSSDLVVQEALADLAGRIEDRGRDLD